MYFVIVFGKIIKHALICYRVRMDVLFCNLYSNGNQHWRWRWGNLACGWMPSGYLFIYYYIKETIKTTPVKATGYNYIVHVNLVSSHLIALLFSLFSRLTFQEVFTYWLDVTTFKPWTILEFFGSVLSLYVSCWTDPHFQYKKCTIESVKRMSTHGNFHSELKLYVT